MKIVKLGENLYEVKLPFWYWTTRGYLRKALLEIQGYDKTITSVYFSPGWRNSYFVTTM